MPDAGVDKVGEGKAVDYAMWDHAAPEIELRHKTFRSSSHLPGGPHSQASEAAMSCVPRTVAPLPCRLASRGCGPCCIRDWKARGPDRGTVGCTQADNPSQQSSSKTRARQKW